MWFDQIARTRKIRKTNIETTIETNLKEAYDVKVPEGAADGFRF